MKEVLAEEIELPELRRNSSTSKIRLYSDAPNTEESSEHARTHPVVFAGRTCPASHPTKAKGTKGHFLNCIERCEKVMRKRYWEEESESIANGHLGEYCSLRIVCADAFDGLYWDGDAYCVKWWVP